MDQQPTAPVGGNFSNMYDQQQSGSLPGGLDPQKLRTILGLSVWAGKMDPAKANLVMSFLGPQEKNIPAARLQTIADMQSSQSNFDNLSSLINQRKDQFGPLNIGGRIADFGGIFADPQRENTKTTISLLTAQLVHALSGVAASDSERQLYQSMMPSLNDSAEVAQQKLKAVQDIMHSKMQTSQDVYNAGGYNAPQTDPTQQTQTAQFNPYQGV
jgi:hypothetical protein